MHSVAGIVVSAVGILVAGVGAKGATSPSNGVMVHLGGVRSGLVGAVGVARMVCEGVPGRKLVTQGTGLINWSMSVAQSSRACSCSTGLTGVLAVADGAWFRTSP